MADHPSTNRTNGGDGRDDKGRFAPGCGGGPGNPHAQQVAALRSTLIGAVSPDDMLAVVRKLLEMAKGGDINAIRELLTRTLGKPTEADLIERLESLETRLAERTRS